MVANDQTERLSRLFLGGGVRAQNCYADHAKILAHYGCTFDDVILENL